MITLSEERKESRRANDELWDKKFTDNEDLDSNGHLSRTEHRKQRSHRVNYRSHRYTTYLLD